MSKKIITHNNGIIETRETFYTEKTIQQLKQQLVEKDKEIAHLKEKDNYHLRYELAGADETITNLKQQLEEKDKEIETMKKDSDKNIDYLVEFASLIENEKDCNRMLKALDRVKSGNKYIIDKANQSKTEFAIQELEKVKELLITESKRYPIVYDITDDLVGGAIDKDKTFEIIDNQIKELKKG